MSSDVQNCIPSSISERSQVVDDAAVTARDYTLWHKWINGAKPKDLAESYGMSQRHVNRRLRVLELNINQPENMQRDLSTGLSELIPGALEVIRQHVVRGNLQAALEVIRLNSHVSGNLGDFLTGSATDKLIVEVLEIASTSGEIVERTGDVTKTVRTTTKKLTKFTSVETATDKNKAE